jgi:RNA polymerase sigma factor (sigma-70 family)
MQSGWSQVTITVTSAPWSGAWFVEVVCVDELPSIVTAAQHGDIDAFTELVRRYQDLAFATAYARLRDPHLAQDVAQEAFLQAHRDLPMLREPAVFPHWLRRIVAKYVDRVVRGGKLRTVPLDEALGAQDGYPEPSSVAEAHELSDLVNAEIARLPERERIVIALFYTADRPMADVAAFLGVPTSTIKKRLFDARRRMKDRIMNQFGDSLREHRPSQNEHFTQRVQFMIAVRTGDISTARRLLQADPSFVRATLPREAWGEPEMGQPTLPLEFDYTPLHFAATYGHLELARVLLAHGADVDDATPGETPLDRAVIMRDVPMATLLLEHAADPDHPSGTGLTALHRAAIRGHSELVRLLLGYRANPLAGDRSGRTALDWATLEGWQEVSRALRGEPPALNLDVEPASTSALDAWLGRVLDVDGNALDGNGPAPALPMRSDQPPTGSQPARSPGPLLETGIKALDLLAPLSRGGTARLSARGGVGMMVLLAELSRRLARRGGRTVVVRWQERFSRVEDALREFRELGTDEISAMILGRLADPTERREQALLTGWNVAEAFRDDGRDVLLIIDVPPAGLPELDALRARHLSAVGPGSITLLVFDLVLPNTGFESPSTAPGDWDAYISFDLQLARRGLFPAIDPLASTSRLLRDALVDPQHAQIATQVRTMLEWSRTEHPDTRLAPDVLSTRARRLELFQTQPFFVAEPWTALPGESVAFDDTLAEYGALVDGAADAVPEETLRYLGRWRPTAAAEVNQASAAASDR